MPGPRPTSARVREALFDILGARIQGASFLDAYAGTGAVGIEALSRGARQAVFLERDRRCLRLIRENLTVPAWRDAACVLGGDVTESLRRLRRRGERFQIAFLDPPYDTSLSAGLLAMVATVVETGGVIILEHRAPVAPALPPPALVPGRSYRYGDTGLTVFHRIPDEPRPR